ncbi:MAG: hypothetical protein LBH09_06640 [Peptococcaceae bacterium]|jgi:cell division protein FtsB|nr:hypothetical protein [Peptococcaceae bacterium]
MFSFSFDDIVKLFQGTSLVYTIVLLVLGFAFGFLFTRFLFRVQTENLKSKEELLSAEMANISQIKSQNEVLTKENDSLKAELEELKSTVLTDAWISQRKSQPAKNPNSDVSKI